jgi:ABC-type antimicrobial peptide transport system permease subunit
VVAASGSLDEVAAGLRLAARAAEPELAFRVTPLSHAVALWQLPSRAAAAASGVLAAMALLIASIGLFGVLSQLLAQQTRELGIRRALGADGRALVIFSMRQAVGLVLPGLAGGLLLGHVIARAIAAFLFDLSPADLPTYLAATVVATCAAVAACLLPARRAARVDPMTVLRME